ncbi:hypothetical protein DFJ74DRAFT_677917 [Hyaloraphidium curvatum]|nr:hypothetical protein DFJ74DRAFT_677917 [Hyaloraphidium curvatum]
MSYYASCAHCGKEAPPPPDKLARCSNCKRAAYCDSECQRAAWPSHKRDCVAEIPAPNREKDPEGYVANARQWFIDAALPNKAREAANSMANNPVAMMLVMELLQGRVKPGDARFAAFQGPEGRPARLFAAQLAYRSMRDPDVSFPKRAWDVVNGWEETEMVAEANRKFDEEHPRGLSVEEAKAVMKEMKAKGLTKRK